jgi:hypothetical protein
MYDGSATIMCTKRSIRKYGFAWHTVDTQDMTSPSVFMLLGSRGSKPNLKAVVVPIQDLYGGEPLYAC